MEKEERIVLVIFFLYGLGGWIAWNAAITGIDFFNARFQPQHDPGFMFGFVFTWPLFAGNILLLYLNQKLSFVIQINVSLVMILICTGSMPFITQYLPLTSGWWLLLVSIFLNGLANSFVQGGLFGFASIFPKKFMAMMMISQAISGVLITLIKMILLVALPPGESEEKKNNLYYNSVIYIIVGGIVLVACIIAFNFGFKLEYIQRHIEAAKTKNIPEGFEGDGISEQVSILDKTIFGKTKF